MGAKVLAPPAAIRKRFIRELASVGVRFCSVFLVPNGRIAEIKSKAAEFQDEFEQAAADIVANLAKHYDDQEVIAEALHPGIHPFLRSGRWASSEVLSAFRWDVHFCDLANLPEALNQAA